MTTPLDSFQSGLLAELKQAAATRTARRRRRTIAALGSSLVVAASTACALALLLDTPTRAFAVEETGHGDIAITLTALTDAPGLQDALAEHGLHADVDYTGTAPTPTPLPDPQATTTEAPPPVLDAQAVAAECSSGALPSLAVSDDRAVITIPADSLPADTPLTITTTDGRDTLASLTLSWEGASGVCVVEAGAGSRTGGLRP